MVQIVTGTLFLLPLSLYAAERVSFRRAKVS